MKGVARLDFSILMAVYYKDNPAYFSDAIDSVLSQTLKPKEIVIVKDGPLTEDLEQVIMILTENYPNLFRVIQLETNKGLGLALQMGVKKCRYEIIARMDSDDLAHPQRFEKQIPYMYRDPEIDVLGSWVLEFDNKSGKEQYLKKVPLGGRDLVLYSKKRNPLNHMTVVFRKTSVLKAGNYQPFLWNEDYYLWARMINYGFKVQNLEDVLVYVRAGNDLFRRRGGLLYIKNECKLQREFLRMKFITPLQFCFNIIIRSFVRVMPTLIRKRIYKNFFRSNGN
jgi:glycosyltransferase involved in cell wall biosynthesis